MIVRLKSGGRLKALSEPKVGQIVVITGGLSWAREKGVVIDKRRHTSFDGMENCLMYNVLVQGTLIWFQSFEIEILEDS